MKGDPLFLEDPVVDPVERWVRLICGALLGLVGGLLIVVRCRIESPLGWVPALGLSIGVCAWGALRYGDEFWRGVMGRTYDEL